MFTDTFFYSVIIPALPFALEVRLGIPPTDVQQWTSTLFGCYAGALLVASPICGWLADRAPSRRLPFVLGLLALGSSTLFLCFGSSIAVLILGRLFQGISGAVMWTSGVGLLVDSVGQQKIGKTMGFCSLAIQLAMLLGPVLGGSVFAQSGYYAVFGMAFGLVFLDVVLRLVVVEKTVAAKWNSARKESPTTPCSIDTSSVLTVESPTTRDYDTKIPPPSHLDGPPPSASLPRLPPVITLLRSPRLLVALWGVLVQIAVLCAFDSVLPLFVHRTFGWGPTGAGLIFVTIVAPFFAAPFVGWVADRYGARWLVAAGFSLCLPLLVLLRVVTHNSLPQIVLLCVLLVLVGANMTLIMPPLMAEITYAVAAEEKKNPGMFGKGGAYGQAYGLYYCWLAGGALIGPMWAGFVEQRAGWDTMTWTLGLLSGITAIPILIFTGGPVTKRLEK